MKKVLSKVGQSTLEYVIVLTAIVAAILFAATQFIKPSVNNVYGEAGKTLNASGGIFSSNIGGNISMGTVPTTGSTTTSPSTTSPSTTSPTTNPTTL